MIKVKVGDGNTDLTLIDPSPICPDEDRPGMFLSSDYLRTEPGWFHHRFSKDHNYTTDELHRAGMFLGPAYKSPYQVSTRPLVAAPKGGSVNVYGAARPRWQEKWVPRRGITTAGTELMWLIDHKPNNQNEAQYSNPHKIGDIGVSTWASNKISFCWVWLV